MIDCTNVLLIEDNDDHAKLVERFTEGFDDIKIERQSNLANGLNYLKKHKPHAILLDLALPDSSKEETFWTAYENVNSIPIIVLSSLENPEFAVEIIKSGASGYICKSELTSELIYNAISNAIKSNKLKDISIDNLKSQKSLLEEKIRQQTEMLKKEEEDFFNILESSPLCNILINKKCDILYYNKAFESVFQNSKNQTPIFNLHDIFTSTFDKDFVYSRVTKEDVKNFKFTSYIFDKKIYCNITVNKLKRKTYKNETQYLVTIEALSKDILQEKLDVINSTDAKEMSNKYHIELSSEENLRSKSNFQNLKMSKLNLSNFIDETIAHMAELGLSAECEDIKKIKQISFRINSSAMCFGLKTISEIAKNIFHETKAENPSFENILNLIYELETEFTNFRKSASKELNS